MIDILIPKRLSSDNLTGLEDFFNLVLQASSKEENINFNFAQLGWTDPFGYTTFFNLIRWLHEKDTRITFSNHRNIHNQTILYMNDCGFFEFFGLPKIKNDGSMRSTTISKILSPVEKSMWYESSLSNWLSRTTGLPIAAFGSLQVVLFEMFSNIQDHSGAEKGAFFAQHYPHKHQLAISLSDIGVGIPTTVRRKLPALSDVDCIAKACEGGFTVQSVQGNMGRGLEHLINTVVGHCNGIVRICSLSGYYEISQNYERIKKIDLSCMYPGTSIEIVIDLTQLPDEGPQIEDFEW